MIAVTSFRAAAALALRGPWAWAWFALACGLASTFSVLGPIGITSSRPDPAGALYELAFMGLTVGALHSLATGQRLEWMARSHPGLPGLSLLLGHHLGSICIFSSLGVGAAWLMGLLPQGATWVGALIRATGLSLALTTVLSLLPLPTVARGLAFLAMTWWVPALLAGVPPHLAGWIQATLEPLPARRSPLDGDPTGAGWGSLLGPIMGWSALAALLAGGPHRTRHALRDPR